MTSVQNRAPLLVGQKAERPRDQGERLGPVIAGGGPLARRSRRIGLEDSRRLAVNPCRAVEQSVIPAVGQSRCPRVGDCLSNLVLLDEGERSSAQSAVVGGVKLKRSLKSRTASPAAPLNR